MFTPDEAPIRVLTPSGLQFLHGLSEQNRSIVGQHWNAVRRYLEYGDDSQLPPFNGYTVTATDPSTSREAPVQLESDLEAIEWHAVRGDVTFESIYDEVV